MQDSEEIIVPLNEPGKIIAEYGNVGGIRFLNPICAKLTDTDGNEIMCKCGKPATETIIGKEAFLARCYECASI